MIQSSTTKSERANQYDKIEPKLRSVMLTVATFDDAFCLPEAVDLCLALQHHLIFVSAADKGCAQEGAHLFGHGIDI
jgi:hypothetical protein